MRAWQGHWREGLAWTWRASRVRLRFLAALAVAFLIVARWDVLRTHWDRWTSPRARDASMGAVSSLTEYFCPMDPGVLSSWPGKCPVCQMATVRRSKGDMGPLPSGVVARVQLSPDRLLLGGIRSEPVRFRPLAREIRSLGSVIVLEQAATIAVEFTAEEAGWIEPDQAVEVLADPPDGSLPVVGRIARTEAAQRGTVRVGVEVPEAPAWLQASRFALILVRTSLAGREPFRSMPQGDPPMVPGEPRAVHACPDHPDAIRVEPGRCPIDQKPLERFDLAKPQRLGWWCPMHPNVQADRPGATCGECQGMVLVPRIITYRPAGEVLAVPESAVIDTGTKTMVYVERMPGMFDGVEVRLGPRSGSFYAVVEGLEPGQVVAGSGAFLVDAETRLNPSLAAGYFGAKRPDAVESKPAAASEGLDRDLIQAQGTCPVTGKRLGSMGTPVRIVANGRTVFLCCEACQGAIQADPGRYLARLKPASGAVHHP